MPPRAVVDNNLAISFLLSNGATLRTLFERWRGGAFVYVTSPGILSELQSVVRRPRFQERWMADPDTLLASIERDALMTAGAALVSGVCRDPDDDKFLSCAVEANADYLVTGDGDLLDLDPFRGVRIVTPRAFVELLDAAELD